MHKQKNCVSLLLNLLSQLKPTKLSAGQDGTLADHDVHLSFYTGIDMDISVCGTFSRKLKHPHQTHHGLITTGHKRHMPTRCLALHLPLWHIYTQWQGTTRHQAGSSSCSRSSTSICLTICADQTLDERSTFTNRSYITSYVQ